MSLLRYITSFFGSYLFLNSNIILRLCDRITYICSLHFFKAAEELTSKISMTVKELAYKSALMSHAAHIIEWLNRRQVKSINIAVILQENVQEWNLKYDIG